MATFNVPIGTVIAYAGEVNQVTMKASGWLYCDGRELSPNDPDYTDLFNLLGTYYGGDGVSTFNLPDYRGRFLRGVDDGTGTDPNADTRTGQINVNGKPGSAKGDDVGSVQADAFAQHTHTIMANNKDYKADGGNNYPYTTKGNLAGPTGGSDTAGAETRPKNTYVNYLIKYVL